MASITNTRAASILTGISTAVDAGTGPGIVRVYNGTAPSTLDDPLSGNTLLAELTMSDPAFGSPADISPGSRITASAITDDSSADASGTPTFVRIFDSDLNGVVQLSAGVGSGEANFQSAITAGLPVRITALTITQPEA